MIRRQTSTSEEVQGSLRRAGARRRYNRGTEDESQEWVHLERLGPDEVAVHVAFPLDGQPAQPERRKPGRKPGLRTGGKPGRPPKARQPEAEQVGLVRPALAAAWEPASTRLGCQPAAGQLLAHTSRGWACLPGLPPALAAPAQRRLACGTPVEAARSWQATSPPACRACQWCACLSAHVVSCLCRLGTAQHLDGGPVGSASSPDTVTLPMMGLGSASRMRP